MPFLLVVALTLAAPEVAESSDPLKQERARLVALMVPRIVQLGEWCRSRKLRAEQERLARVILSEDPDCEEARAWLGYARNREGRWEQDKKHTPGRNRNARALRQLPKKARSLLGKELASLYAWHQEQDGAEAWLRHQTAWFLVELDPEDERFREAHGEIRSGEDWILRETRSARTRRRQILRMAVRALDRGPAPRQVAIPSAARKFALPWRVAAKGERLGVVSTGEASDALKVAAYAEATEHLFHELFDTDVTIPDGLTLALLVNAGDRAQLIESIPVAYADRGWWGRVAGFAVPGTTIWALTIQDADRRLDGAVRQIVSLLLDRWLDLGTANAWVVEGVGLYLTYALTGTRLTWMIRRSRYAHESEATPEDRLNDSKANWFALASEARASGRLPRLVEATAVDLNTMTREDALVAYVFVAYLLETQSDSASRLLRRVAAERSPLSEASQELLGLDLHALERRMFRWMDENR